MRDVVIDTAVASLLQKHQAPPWLLRELAGARICLTFVTVGELARAAQLHGRPKAQNDSWIAACCLRYQVPLHT